MEQKFLTQFNEVFDDNYEIKSCGRNDCIRLIELARQIEPSVNFGSIKTGFMNTTNLIRLRNKLKESS